VQSMWQAPQVSAHRRLGPRASRSHHAAPFKSSACWPIDHTAPQGVSNAETL